MDASAFYRGTSSEQDGRFSNQDEEQLKKMKFPLSFNEKVNFTKINMGVIEKWIKQRVSEILGIDDEVTETYVCELLKEKDVSPKRMQVSLTPMLSAETPHFMEQLWNMLLEAQKTADGIPSDLAEKKKEVKAEESVSTQKTEIKKEKKDDGSDKSVERKKEGRDGDDRSYHHRSSYRHKSRSRSRSRSPSYRKHHHHHHHHKSSRSRHDRSRHSRHHNRSRNDSGSDRDDRRKGNYRKRRNESRSRSRSRSRSESESRSD